MALSGVIEAVVEIKREITAYGFAQFYSVSVKKEPAMYIRPVVKLSNIVGSDLPERSSLPIFILMNSRHHGFNFELEHAAGVFGK